MLSRAGSKTICYNNSIFSCCFSSSHILFLFCSNEYSVQRTRRISHYVSDKRSPTTPCVSTFSTLSLRLEQTCLTVSFPNHLDPDSYEGTIDGIRIKWNLNSRCRLPLKAGRFNIAPNELKAATEHLAHASAKRLSKTGATIWYAAPRLSFATLISNCF